MPTDETPPQPQAMAPEQREQESLPPEQVFAGENGDPIWEPQWAQRQGGAGRAERLPPGRLIDLAKSLPFPGTRGRGKTCHAKREIAPHPDPLP